MLNLNKLFPWLSIRSKLIIAFAGLSIIPVALVGLHGIFSNVNMMKQIALENLTHDVQTIREKTANFLSSVEIDLRLIRNSTNLRELSRALDNSRSQAENDVVQRFETELLAFARTKGIYYQLRMVSERGDEQFRVECITNTDSVRDYRVVPRSELRDGRETYYFFLVDGIDKDEIAFTPAELVNASNDRIPIISFAMPIVAMKGRVGILIADVFAKDLFQVVEIRRHLNADGRVVLVRSDGHYLYHSEKKKDWNRLLASREEDNLQNEYPAAAVATLLSGNDGVITTGVDDIISYAPLFTNRSFHRVGRDVSESRVPLFVFESVPKDLVMAPVRSFAWTFAAFLILFLATAIGLGLVATQQFTKPIGALQRGAEIIAKGNYQHRLQVETHDEIEKLAAQFNSMAASLEDHDREIQLHRVKLEEMVQQRTQELTEEKATLQDILDNVPSAFVLLNKNFRIQTASLAFAGVTGFRLEDVRGRDCAEVFCGSGLCQECVSRKAMLTRNIESHVDHVSDRKGHGRFIEHVAIPMKENGEIRSILEVITDVTRRKRFEQRLIQTERLMAAGETSAFIAHEFRNALTSIKMILQLQKESKHHTRSDKKSLGVALNSIYHMERVVTELLNFARPSPMEFRMEELTDVIDESVNFIKLHLNKRRIQLNKRIELAIPPLELDAPRFKEALVNILLNAVQAIEGKPALTVKEEVSVSAKKIILRTALHDFVFSDLVENPQQENGSERGKEIVLRKGTQCVVVEVRDTGPGIPRGLVRRIFDPFFTTKSNGTGLGLAMVKHTVNAHGGIVTLETKKGHRTTFKIYLPFHNQA